MNHYRYYQQRCYKGRPTSVMAGEELDPFHQSLNYLRPHTGFDGRLSSAYVMVGGRASDRKASVIQTRVRNPCRMLQGTFSQSALSADSLRCS